MEQSLPITELERLRAVVDILLYSDIPQKRILDSVAEILVKYGISPEEGVDGKDFIKDQLSNIHCKLNNNNFKTLFKTYFNWICVCIFVHSLVEAVCELLCRMKKTENKQKFDMERFGKDLVERITCCGKDGFLSRSSIIKVPIKILLSGCILNYLRFFDDDLTHNSAINMALRCGILYLFFAFITFCLELLCEAKDRMLHKPGNSNDFRGFRADLGKRCIKGKKEDSIGNWAAVKFPLKVAIIALLAAGLRGDLNKYREYRFKWLPRWNELERALLPPTG